MLHSKLATMRLGLTTTTAVINTVNRLQFVIEASANGSIPTVGYIARRYQHVLSAKPLMINTSNENARCHSIFNKTPTSVSHHYDISTISYRWNVKNLFPPHSFRPPLSVSIFSISFISWIHKMYNEQKFD